MSKPFNIHDWQAKRRLTEQSSPESMSNADIRALQTIVSDYSLNKILNTLAVIADKTGKHDEANMIQKLASQIQDFNTLTPNYKDGEFMSYSNMDETNTTGTGASFNAGSGEGYMTPNAFKKKKKK